MVTNGTGKGGRRTRRVEPCEIAKARILEEGGAAAGEESKRRRIAPGAAGAMNHEVKGDRALMQTEACMGRDDVADGAARVGAPLKAQRGRCRNGRWFCRRLREAAVCHAAALVLHQRRQRR
jgi:hypothetical protein